MKARKQLQEILPVLPCIIIIIAAAGLFSCGKGGGRDQYPGPVNLTLETTTVTVEAGKSVSVVITGGNGGYSVSVTDPETASAVIGDNSVEITGVAEGSTHITVKDRENISATIGVTVIFTPIHTGKGNVPKLNTATRYDMTVLEGESVNAGGWYTPRDVGNTAVISRADFLSGTNTEALGEFFGEGAGWLDSYDDVYICGGYWEEGSPTRLDMGYNAVPLRMTDTKNEDGTYRIEVLASTVAHLMRWKDYDTGTDAEGFYDPEDESFTIKVSGQLDWGLHFLIHRRYAPVKL